MSTSLICLVRQALGLKHANAGHSAGAQIRHESRTVRTIGASDLRQVSAGTETPPPLPRGGW
jgi:hypothetical protein